MYVYFARVHLRMKRKFSSEFYPCIYSVYEKSTGVRVHIDIGKIKRPHPAFTCALRNRVPMRARAHEARLCLLVDVTLNIIVYILQ